MPKSEHLRIPDVYAIYELADECRQLGDDPNVWWRHYARRLAGLAGADFAACGQVANMRPEGADTLGIGDWGMDNGFDPEPWMKSIEAFDNDPSYSEQNREYLSRLAEEDGVCLSRTDLMSDAEWWETTMFQKVNEPMGADHYLWCFRSLPRSGEQQHGAVVLLRAAGRPDFSERDKAIVREANAVIGNMVSGPLAGFVEPSPSALPPRARQVLRCLLEGDADKQVAHRLSVSPHTVNQYTKVIFRHFNVASRGELLARWIKRGWGAKCLWAEED
jgi:DNA-binding CsgD family transcriptional regulator